MIFAAVMSFSCLLSPWEHGHLPSQNQISGQRRLERWIRCHVQLVISISNCELVSCCCCCCCCGVSALLLACTEMLTGESSRSTSGGTVLFVGSFKRYSQILLPWLAQMEMAQPEWSFNKFPWNSHCVRSKDDVPENLPDEAWTLFLRWYQGAPKSAEWQGILYWMDLDSLVYFFLFTHNIM